MPKFKAKVVCSFDIEFDDDNIEIATENIELDTVENLIGFMSEDSIEYIEVRRIKKID